MKHIKFVFTFAFAMLAAFLLGGEADPINGLEVAAATSMGLVSTEQTRAAYERFAEAIKLGTNGKIKAPMIHPQLLRLEATLDATTNTYQFYVQKAAGSQDNPTEIKLDKNEMIYVLGMSLGIAKYDAAGANPGNAIVQTYPSQFVFNTAASGSDKSEADALETVYNGKLDVLVNQKTILKNFNTNLLRYVPTEQGSASTRSSFGGSVAEMGIFEFQPGVIFTAEDQIDINLKLGSGNRTAIGGTSSQNTLVLHLFGFVFTGDAGDTKYTL